MLGFTCVSAQFGEVFDTETGETTVDLSSTAAEFQLAASIERLGKVDVFCSHVTSQLTAEQARAVYANDELRSFLKTAKQQGTIALLGTSCSYPKVRLSEVEEICRVHSYYPELIVIALVRAHNLVQVLEAALDAGELDGIGVVQMSATSMLEHPTLVSKLHRRGVRLILNSLIRGCLGSSSAELTRAEMSAVLDDVLQSRRQAHTVLIGTRDMDRQEWLAKEICERSALGGRLRVVMAQLRVHVGSPETNVHALIECMKRNAATADLVVAPECFVSGYGSEEAVSRSETANGPSCQALCKAAKETGLAVVYGFCERARNGCVALRANE